MNPTIPVLPTNDSVSWPEGDKGPPTAARYRPIGDALTRGHATDAHAQACSVPSIPHRLRKASLASLPSGVPMVLFFVDVDGPDHTADDAWWQAQRSNIDAMRAKHPGGYVYRTRGGYRIVYLLPEPRVIRSDDDEASWSLTYHRWLLHLAREYQITGDPACADWTRLYRLPHATRDRKHGPERLETIGDPDSIGTWSCATDLTADKETCRDLHETFLRTHPDAKSSPWEPVLRRLDPPPVSTEPAKGERYTGSGMSPRARAALDAECADLASLPAGSRNAACNVAAVKLGHLVNSGELSEHDAAEALFEAMSANGSVRDDGADAVRATIRSGLTAGKKTPPKTPLRANGKTPRPPTDPNRPLNAPDGMDPDTGEIPMDGSPAGEPEAAPAKPRRFNRTDLGNAERLVARYGARIRYCPPKRKWLVWDGRRWTWDERGTLNSYAKATVRAIYREASDAGDDAERIAISKHAAGSESADKLASMVRLAQSERGIVVLPVELDANPWIFNCENGTVDLRTSTLRPHNRADLCTKMAPVRYDPDATSELWVRYLRDATGDDATLIAYLQRMAGYALTGVATEKCLFFIFGPPDSTKSTFIDALTSTMGDYHASADFTTWCVQSNTGGNRGDLVRLAGARLVTSVEVRKGAKFDEQLIKHVTGGDEITAAAKYEAEVTFRATFAILLAANDAPKVRDDDDGMWSRMRRVPFVRVPATRDPAVKATLRDPAVSGPAILAWAVRGCLAWQAEGLGSAPAVDNSTNAYRQEMDRIAGFLDEHCEFHPEFRVWKSTFADAYRRWCQEQGIKVPLTPQEVAERVRDHDVDDGYMAAKRAWVGVRLTDRNGPATGPTTHTTDHDTDPQNSSHESSREKVSGNGVVHCRDCCDDLPTDEYLDRLLPRGDA